MVYLPYFIHLHFIMNLNRFFDLILYEHFTSLSCIVYGMEVKLI